jgi:trk system potassium uptake protein TrkA
MKIVIAGAGDMGFHLGKLLANEQHDIVLIDSSQDVLDYAATHIDVRTVRGDSSSLSVLNQANAGQADLFLAVTTSEKNNIVSGIIAKKMGAKQTIARIKNEEYLCGEQKDSFRELGIDKLISPVQLASQEVERLVELSEATDHFEFEEGMISVIGVTLDDSSALINRSLTELKNMHPGLSARPIAILRGNETILPRGRQLLRRNDHIYFIVKRDEKETLIKILGKELQKIKKIMVIGGTELGVSIAKRLERKYNVVIVESDKFTCKGLIDQLDDALVIKGDPSNLEILHEEGLQEMDAFIAVTPNSETNILTSLLAEQEGVFKTIALVDNTDYTHISQNIGIDTLINKKLIAANNIFRYVRKGQIEAITSLHGVNAEIIEFVVHKNNRLTRAKLRDLHFPQSAIIGGVIRGDQSLIPDGDFQLQVNDKVIVFSMPESISRVEEMFR